MDMGSQSMAERVWILEAQGWVGWRMGIVAGRVPSPQPCACLKAPT